jgi:hypothetical protein
MANTTNYSWETPDDTDLVKDGAAAIRTLGSAIDTTTKALNPSTTLGDIEYRSSTANTNTRLPIGTAGQVLKVNSGGTAPEWATDATGMTNPMTTTGDTIYSSSGSTPARLGIGSTGQVLVVSGGVPTWGTAGGMTQLATGTFSGSSVTISSISSAYRDLKLVIRNFKPANDGDDLRMRLNGDTSQIYADKATTTTSRVDQQFSANASYFPVSTGQDNAAADGLLVLDIPDYANTTTWKFWNVVGLNNNSTTSTNYNLKWNWGAYNLTGAISQIELYCDNFTSGNYYLYGVK